MNTFLTSLLGSRLLAGFGTVAPVAGVGLAASRPAHTAGDPTAVTVANTPLAATPTGNPDKQGVQFNAFLVFPGTSPSSTVRGPTRSRQASGSLLKLSPRQTMKGPTPRLIPFSTKQKAASA